MAVFPEITESHQLLQFLRNLSQNRNHLHEVLIPVFRKCVVSAVNLIAEYHIPDGVIELSLIHIYLLWSSILLLADGSYEEENYGNK